MMQTGGEYYLFIYYLLLLLLFMCCFIPPYRPFRGLYSRPKLPHFSYHPHRAGESEGRRMGR